MASQKHGNPIIPQADVHRELFRNMVKYLARLRRDGDVDDETFKGLLSETLAVYVENEISERFDRVLERVAGNTDEFVRAARP